MPNSTICAAAAAVIALVATTAAPANAGAGEADDEAEEAAVVAGNAVAREVRDAIRANYIVSEKIPAVIQVIDRGIADGRYVALEGRGLADRLSQDLAAAAKDKHLAIQFDPVRASMIKGPIGDEVHEGPQWERMARSMNHGIAELRLMDGNVRYMNLTGFAWTGAKSASALDNAMQFLGEGEAIIIDLRYNGGGSPKAVQYLFSHFVTPGKPLMTFYMSGGKVPEREVALTELPAGRSLGKPLYVITSRMSISAAEAFAALVKDFQVGHVVGETTAGAAYRNSFFPIASKYMLSISVGRGEVGRSKVNWEGVGVTPTIKADMASGVEAAHLAPLRQLSVKAPQPDKMLMEAKATVLEAKLEPKTAAHPLEVYTGAYEDREISLAGGKLYVQRRHGARTRLLPLGGNTFIMEGDPTTKVEYAFAEGGANAIEVIRGDGTRQRHPRTR